MSALHGGPRARRTRRVWRATAALPWLVACIYAQAWADPMRPLIPPASAASGVSAANPALDGSSAAERRAKSGQGDGPGEFDRLVAIRLDSGRHWKALMGERWVQVGDRLDSYTVGAIDANSVQLANGRQRRTLHLLPPLWRPGPKGLPLASSPPARGSSTDLAQASAAALPPPQATGRPTP